MEWTFTGEVIEWRGPAPYLFVAMATVYGVHGAAAVVLLATAALLFT
jgi:hypothetical protein